MTAQIWYAPKLTHCGNGKVYENHAEGQDPNQSDVNLGLIGGNSDTSFTFQWIDWVPGWYWR